MAGNYQSPQRPEVRGGYTSSSARSERFSYDRRRKRRRRRSPLPYLFLFLLIAALLVGGFFLIKNLFGGKKPEGGSVGASSQTVSSTANVPSSQAGTASVPTATPTPTPAPTPPPIEDDGSEGYLSAGIYIWNKKAFELFYGDTEAATAYAHAISSYRDQLPNSTVYNMVVPNHSEYGLPERLRSDMGCTSQRQNLTDVFSNYTSDVKAVDIYDALNMHRNEYLYFNTDTHWAPLGAYYAYQKFCEVAGVQPAALDSMKKSTVEGFTGYLYSATEETVLSDYPDYIDVYEPVVPYTAALSYDGDSFEELPGVNSTDSSMGYSMLGWGDLPCLKLVNQNGGTGRKLAMVKDSYGDAMATFLVNSFDEVYVIDFRSFPKNLPAYCEANGITDVLFFNNVMSANTSTQIESMDALFN